MTSTGLTRRRTGRARLRRGASALALRELTLLPVIGLAIIAGALIRRLPDHHNFLNILQQSSELSVLVIAES